MVDTTVLHELMPPNHLLPKRVSAPESEYNSKDFPDFVIPQLHENNRGQQPIHQWEAKDILRWIIQVAEKFEVNYSDFGGENYANIKGSDLLLMSEMDFEEKSPGFGKFLHDSLHMENIKSSSSSIIVNPDYTEQDGRSYLNLAGAPKSSYQGSESDSENSRPSASESPRPKTVEAEPPADPPKKKRGRPRGPNKKGKKKPQTFGRLWEFLRELLKKPESCPDLIKWENHDEGEFRFMQSDKVAKIWGTRKGNREMTYEKLSRAMRYYYKSDVLQPVRGRRLVYRFGPRATNWRVDDPNFEKARSRNLI